MRIIWLVQRLEDVPSGDDWLGVSEKSTQSRFRFPKRRNDWRLGRWTAKNALRSFLAFESDLMPFRALEVLATSDGSPLVYFQRKPLGVSLSISHSEAAGLCVVGPPSLRLGCDLERIQPGADFMEDFFCKEEVQWMDQYPVEERPLLAYLIWSGKESALKVLREGLRRDTRTVRVSADFSREVSGWRPLTAWCLQTGFDFQGWWRVHGNWVITILSNAGLTPPEIT